MDQKATELIESRILDYTLFMATEAVLHGKKDSPHLNIMASLYNEEHASTEQEVRHHLIALAQIAQRKKEATLAELKKAFGALLQALSEWREETGQNLFGQQTAAVDMEFRVQVILDRTRPGVQPLSPEEMHAKFDHTLCSKKTVKAMLEIMEKYVNRPQSQWALEFAHKHAFDHFLDEILEWCRLVHSALPEVDLIKTATKEPQLIDKDSVRFSEGAVRQLFDEENDADADGAAGQWDSLVRSYDPGLAPTASSATGPSKKQTKAPAHKATAGAAATAAPSAAPAAAAKSKVPRAEAPRQKSPQPSPPQRKERRFHSVRVERVNDEEFEHDDADSRRRGKERASPELAVERDYEVGGLDEPHTPQGKRRPLSPRTIAANVVRRSATRAGMAETDAAVQNLLRASQNLTNIVGDDDPINRVPNYPARRAQVRRSVNYHPPIEVSDSDEDESGRKPKLQITTPRLSTPQELRSLNVEREGQRIASPVRRIPGRKRPWGEEEVANLIQGVEKYGVGAWCVIRDNVYLNFRSSVDIKDKWRNLVKTGEVNPADYTLVDRSVYSRSGSRTNTPQQKKKKKKTTTTTNTTREKVEMGQW
eukprot:m.237121 g.237121  ORF g.237121 m.237121 type:complete len:594 (+) comp22495_c1_seq3:285-2066(+)